MESVQKQEKFEPTPGVKDISNQTRDPQSAGSRGLVNMIRDNRHPMRRWLDLMTPPENKHDPK